MDERADFRLTITVTLLLLTLALATGLLGSVVFLNDFADLTQARVVIFCDSDKGEITCTSTWITIDGTEGSGPVDTLGVDNGEAVTTVDGYVDDDGMAYAARGWEWKVYGSLVLAYFPGVGLAALLVALVWFRPQLRIAVRERRRWPEVLIAGLNVLSPSAFLSTLGRRGAARKPQPG